MSNDIAGIFIDQTEAHKGLSDLLDAGFTKEKISLIVSDKAHHIIFGAPADDEGNRATRGGAAGALWGGAVGLLLAGLTTVGTVLVPGAGLLVAGPVISMLTGVGAGAAVGGLSGALIAGGFAADDAKRFEKEVSAGRGVIIVHADNKEEADRARTLLRISNAATRAA